MTTRQLEFFSNKKSYVFLFMSFLFGGLCVYFLLGRETNRSLAAGAPMTSEIPQKTQRDGFAICKVKEFNNIKPLSKESITESPEFTPLKNELQHLVDSLKTIGEANQVSVYLREFDSHGWMALNRDEQYHPASLMKVALLIAYLRMAEANSGLLKQELLYVKPKGDAINTQFYAGPSIESGKKYTIHELLYYMIAYSDNNATWLLASHFDNSIIKKLFSDYCLPEPVEDDLKFTMTAKEYSVFFKTIYSASYIGPAYSEYAAELLSNCTFKEGFVKGLPDNTRMWHKFGEWRNAGHDYELHESGVIFIDDKPYLLTVMTKGNDTEKLAKTISAVARKVYEKISSP